MREVSVDGSLLHLPRGGSPLGRGLGHLAQVGRHDGELQSALSGAIREIAHPTRAMSASQPAPARPNATHPTTTSARMIPFIVGCALFMQMLDSTVVATALPAMARSLGSTPVRLNVAITAYLLAVSVFVPISGWAADRFGARRVFLAAIAMFTLSSVGCALSQTITELVVARVFQGMAGAMMVPVGRIILLRVVPKQDLLRAMSFLSLPALMGPILGPPVGGLLVTYASWHWIFLINIPIGIGGIALVLRFVEEVREETKPRLDFIGFILSSVCMATLVTAFEGIGHSEFTMLQLVAMVVIGIVCGWLYWYRSKLVEYPVIDLSLLRIPTFSISVLAGNLCRFTVGATPFLLALLLQVGFGLSPLAAGFITFASAAGAMVMKFVTTPIVGYFGYRNVLIYNGLLTAAFVIACAAFTPLTPVWVMITVLLIGGFFRSLQFTGINTLSYADIPVHSMSRASSFSAMAQQMGITLGVGVAAVTLNISMALRGSTTLAIRDIAIAFVVTGLISASSSFSFRKLALDAGSQLKGVKPSANDDE
jgi:EmrB/QacA subfamily drug resistance transporter